MLYKKKDDKELDIKLFENQLMSTEVLLSGHGTARSQRN